MIENALKHLIEGIVSNPKDVNVTSSVRGNIEVLSISLNPDDIGIVVGKGGKTIQDLRTVISALSNRNYIRLNIAE
jgi:predicted RNA-binding protein YlqC (UPF0109 family)